MTTASTPGVLLIAEDEPNNIRILMGLFEDDFEVIIAMDGLQALGRAQSARPDLILLDVMMPGMDGYEVCRHLKADPDTADIPVIFLTGLGDERAETEGLNAGAVDYVTKPIKPLIVRKRVSNHIAFKKARDRLALLAVTDGMTGLANRRRFDEVLDIECRRLRRKTSGSLSVILLDVDHFKKYNDTYGHVAGDACLRAVADVVQVSACRATDLAARYGGEEFACVLPETLRAGAADLAERVRIGVAGLNIPHEASATAGFVTVSIGVATVTSECDQMDIDTVVGTADTSLYLAKAGGRNRVAIAKLNP